ncbi:MAG: YkgJ family cysteine cluster protein [bacterium]
MNFKYEQEIDDFKKELDEFPQYLCRRCGKCCKVIATSDTHEELERLAALGNIEAKVFTDLFKRFTSVEEARKAVPEQVDKILDELSYKEDVDVNNVTFYYCPHITEDNLCPMHEKRPTVCSRAPHHGWTCMPPGCGFEGWQFELREKYKQMTRKFKEYLTAVEALSEDGKVPGKDMTIEEFKKLIDEQIKPWSKYGSMFW